MMNAPKKYVVSKTLEQPIWRNTTIIRDNVVESVRALKAQPGGNILTDGSSQLVHALLAHDLVDELHLLVYPLTLGKRQARPAGRRARGLPLAVRDAVSERGRGPPLRPAGRGVTGRVHQVPSVQSSSRVISIIVRRKPMLAKRRCAGSFGSAVQRTTRGAPRDFR